MIKTLWQRYMADTPDFWKKVNLIGLMLAGAVAVVDKTLPQTPHSLLAVLAGIATAVVSLANLAVKDAAIIADPSKATLPDMLAAVNDVKASVASVKASYSEEKAKVDSKDAVTVEAVVNTAVDGIATEEPLVEDWRAKLHADIAAQQAVAQSKAQTL